MTEERTIGIILRLYSLTESSLIIHWLTADFGRVATVAKGARRPKSPFRGKLDLFYEAELTFQPSRKSELHTLRELSLLNTHAQFRTELGWLQQAAYCAALIEQTTETDTPLPGAFALLQAFLDYLPKRPPQPQSIFAFELKLLGELGLAPQWPRSSITPGSEQILQNFVRADWEGVGRIRLSEAQLQEIRQLLHGYLVYHLGKFPDTRAKALKPES